MFSVVFPIIKISIIKIYVTLSSEGRMMFSVVFPIIKISIIKIYVTLSSNVLT